MNSHPLVLHEMQPNRTIHTIFALTLAACLPCIGSTTTLVIAVAAVVILACSLRFLWVSGRGGGAFSLLIMAFLLFAHASLCLSAWLAG